MEKETLLNLVTNLDRLRCGPEIGVGSALHGMICRVNGTPEALVPESYGRRFFCVENIDPFEVVLIQDMVPPVVIRYDDIAQLANRYDDLTAGLKKVLVMSVGEWYIETKDKKAELLKIKKQ
jgi:hypothetical protein